MQDAPRYDDVVGEVCAFLAERGRRGPGRRRAARSGSIPGIGFGKGVEHNLALLAHLDRVVALGWPVLVGTSRKATLGRGSWPTPTGSTGLGRRPTTASAGSIATEVWAMHRGAAMVRAHDVRAAVQAAKVVAA